MPAEKTPAALLLCSCLALCLTAATAPAADAAGGPTASAGKTWIVDGANPQADDSGPGTEEKPFKSVTQAARKAGAGDTVLVMEANYPEKLVIPASAAGREGAVTVFRACLRHAAQVRGVEIAAGHVRLDGFRIVESGVVGRWGDDVQIVDNRFEVRTYGVSPEGAPKKCLLALNYLFKPQSGFIISGRDWVVERNEIETLKQWDKRDSDYSRAFGEGHVIRRNHYHGAKAEEIGTAHTDGCQTWHLKAQPSSGLRRVTFEDNVFVNIGQGIIARNEEANTAFLGEFIVRRNIFGLGMGIESGKMPLGAWGCCLQNVAGFTAENNLFLKCYHGAGMWGGGEFTVRNNISWENGNSFWAAGAERGDSPFAGKFIASHNLATGSRSKLDATNITRDPQFVDVAAGNYRLKKTSPAIGAGEGNVTIGPLEYPNVYTVDVGHPSATDARFGYPAVPFKTLGKACEAAEAGETVELVGGVYREAVVVKKDGLTIRAVKPGPSAPVSAGAKVLISGADLVPGWTKDASGAWSAPLPAAPKKMLRDGQPWADFAYDAAAKRIVAKGGDPRLHVIETVVREHGLDLGGAKNVKLESIEVVNTLGAPVVGAAGK